MWARVWKGQSRVVRASGVIQRGSITTVEGSMHASQVISRTRPLQKQQLPPGPAGPCKQAWAATGLALDVRTCAAAWQTCCPE